MVKRKCTSNSSNQAKWLRKEGDEGDSDCPFLKLYAFAPTGTQNIICKGFPTVNEVKEAELVAINHIQQSIFCAEVNSLKQKKTLTI